MTAREAAIQQRITGDLLRLQAADGGVASAAGAPATTESTALFSLAVPGDPGALARAWLRRLQFEAGAWPLSAEVREPSWATSVALLAFAAGDPQAGDPITRAAEWLLGRKGRPLPLRDRIVQFVLPRDRRVEQDFDLAGWPWHESAQGWVEPTSLSLLALRKASRIVSLAGVEERIVDGEALLWDRVCEGGGWNYGNRRVLDVPLEPFADVTGLALLALSRSSRAIDATMSLDRLEALLEREASGLALSVGSLALEAFGRESTKWRGSLTSRYEQTGFRGEARSLAFALLALRRDVEAILS